MKCILVVSPTPSHPQNAGNRSRIYRFLTELRCKGYKIHFIYTGLECYSEHVTSVPDYVGMLGAWDKFIYIPKLASALVSDPSVNVNTTHRIDQSDALDPGSRVWKIFPGSTIRNLSINSYVRAMRKFNLITRSPKSAFSRAIMKIPLVKKYLGNVFNKNNDSMAEDRHIDARCHPDMASIVMDLHKQYKYDVVMVEYVFLSCALLKLGPDVLKVIDTHDVFAGRGKLYRQSGIEELSFSTIAPEECKGLARADVVVSIQDKEEKYFRRHCNHPKIINIGHMVDVVKPAEVIDKTGNLFYVGAANSANIHGLSAFISRALPEIRGELPWVKLFVAGSIAGSIDPSVDGCVYLGEVDDLRSAYANAHIVINPTSVGTGLKIKNIEALGYAKPLVMMTHGANGLADYADSFVTVENYDEFASVIISLLKDKQQCVDLGEKAFRAAINYNEKARAAFTSVFG